MRKLLISWLISGLALYIAGNIIPGIYISTLEATLIAAIILGVINAFIKPIILIFTLPINLLTLGLFTFVINGFVLMITASLVSGFEVRSLLDAIIGAVIISFANMIMRDIVK